jgi:signal transduction histidine kinase
VAPEGGTAQGGRAALPCLAATRSLRWTEELNARPNQENAPSAAAADVALVGRISAVPTILRLICETTGLGFAAVARVTETSWTACAVLDRIGFGLEPGGELDVATTFCSEVRASRSPIVIDKASEDAAYCGHPTPKLYGFESYIAVPVVKRSGEVFGTICALDRGPAALGNGKTLATLELFAELVAAQIELEERLDTSQTALVDAAELGGSREQFIAVLGHDLRNPIAAVAAGLDLMSRRPLEGRSATLVEQMKRSCRRMSGLVNDILDLSRGRLGGGIPAERREVSDLDETLRQVVEELEGAHPGRAVLAELDLRAPVLCDPRRIAQLFSNLLANALAHGAQDKPVRVSARSGGAGGFVLSVTNEGRPIPPAAMAKLFQPFSREAAEAPRAGLGLGLYIASEIARSHGGTLGATSTDEGTTFTLELPAGSA